MVLHQPHEVGRQMIGQPSVAESTSGSIGGGFGVFGGGGGSSAGAASAEGGLLKRTYCVQQAEIQFDQAYETTPRVVGRGADIAGGVILGLLGVALLADAGQQDGQYDAFGDRQNRTSEFVTGGTMAGIGGALLVYSIAIAPRGPAPVAAQGVNHFTRNELVESAGCQLPGQAAPVPGPGDMPQAGAPGDDTAARLQKLDALRAAGTITEGEYQQKRKAIIDGL